MSDCVSRVYHFVVFALVYEGLCINLQCLFMFSCCACLFVSPDSVKGQMEGFEPKMAECLLSVRFKLCAFWSSAKSENLSMVPINRVRMFPCADVC